MTARPNPLLTGPFLIFDAEDRTDPHVCRTAEDARAVIADLDGQPFQVLTIAVDEFCRDVTEDFIADEDEQADADRLDGIEARQWAAHCNRYQPGRM